MLDKMTGWATGVHTIVWARVLTFVGALWSVLEVTEVAPFLTAFDLGKWTPVVMLGIGLITELIRRYKAEDIPKGT